MFRKYYLFILLVIACSTSLFYGCGNDMELSDEGTGIFINGDMATLTFQVSESLSEQATRSSFMRDTIIQKLNDSLVIETVIEPDHNGGMTRGMTTSNVQAPTKMCTISYSHERGKYYKYELSPVVDGKFSICLPAGETYDLIFYAVNGYSANSGGFKGYFTGTWTSGGDGDSERFLAGKDGKLAIKNDESARDLIFSKYENLTVNKDTKLPHINMKHLFCKVKLNVKLSDNSSQTLDYWKATIGPKSYQEAENINLEDDPINSWRGKGTPTADITLNYKTLIERPFIPSENDEDITLEFTNITLNGKQYSYPSHTFTGYKFKRGCRYNITSTVKKKELDYNITFRSGSSTGYSTITVYKKNGAIWSLLAKDVTNYTYRGGKRGEKLRAVMNINGNTDRVEQVWISSVSKYPVRHETSDRDYYYDGEPIAYCSDDGKELYVTLEPSDLEETKPKTNLDYTTEHYEYAPGNLLANYTFESTQSAPGDRWMPNRKISGYVRVWEHWLHPEEAGDPCTLVTVDGGGWLTPTEFDLTCAFGMLMIRPWVIGSMNSTKGFFFGTSIEPSAADKNKYLFLPMVRFPEVDGPEPGYLDDVYHYVAYYKYTNHEQYDDHHGWYLTFLPDSNGKMTVSDSNYGSLQPSAPLRCVRRK